MAVASCLSGIRSGGALDTTETRPGYIACMRNLLIFVILSCLSAPVAFQAKPIIAPTGEPVLIDSGRSSANFAMTEADYQKLADSITLPAFVPMTRKPEGL